MARVDSNVFILFLAFRFFRYGGLKQSKSCYEKEGETKMCTTINCEFQNTGRECNETITAVNVSVTKNIKNISIFSPYCNI